MSELNALNESYQARFPGSIELKPVFRGETTWLVKTSELAAVLDALNKEGFDFLVDLSTVDNFGEEPRFEVVYELRHTGWNKNLRVKALISEDENEVPTVSHLWRTANWHEREAYDMMGIRFGGHPDLRRILMWEGYPFHPLKKDFPLEGKETEMPDIAFSRPAPLEGGPFVTAPADRSQQREPRARPPEVV
ncbi:MAG: NADH-quinone oxidoreductase subunit C [Blastochloris sp.]|nr:NADH-quinone oxidoreductase subunit C [Blastochloris sp.]